MAIITLPYIYTTGQTIVASQTNAVNQTIYNDYNGNVTDANISADAAIEYSKLSLGNSIRSSDLLSTTIILASNLPVGTAAGDIVQLNGSAQLPPVSGVLLTNLTASLSSIVTYGTSSSSPTPIAQSYLKIAIGTTGSLSGAGGSSTITGLSFTNSTSYIVLTTQVDNGTAGSGNITYLSGASFTITNSAVPAGSNVPHTFSWIAIGT